MDNFLMLDGSNSAAGVFTGTAVNPTNTFTSGTPTASANAIDLSQLASSAKGYGRDIGVGDDIELVCMVTTTFLGSSSTLQVQVQYTRLITDREGRERTSRLPRASPTR
ncbi:MAG: hypothetical protein ACLQBD_26745 [Syntrophobacteraceae bacterium]